jgi:hypothetical protein
MEALMTNLAAAARHGCLPRATKPARQRGISGGSCELEASSFSERQARSIPAGRLAISLEFHPARFHYSVIGLRGTAGRAADKTFNSVRTASSSLNAVSLRMHKE